MTLLGTRRNQISHLNIEELAIHAMQDAPKDQTSHLHETNLPPLWNP